MYNPYLENISGPLGLAYNAITSDKAKEIGAGISKELLLNEDKNIQGLVEKLKSSDNLKEQVILGKAIEDRQKMLNAYITANEGFLSNLNDSKLVEAKKELEEGNDLLEKLKGTSKGKEIEKNIIALSNNVSKIKTKGKTIKKDADNMKGYNFYTGKFKGEDDVDTSNKDNLISDPETLNKEGRQYTTKMYNDEPVDTSSPDKPVAGTNTNSTGTPANTDGADGEESLTSSNKALSKVIKDKGTLYDMTKAINDGKYTTAMRDDLYKKYGMKVGEKKGGNNPNWYDGSKEKNLELRRRMIKNPNI